MSLLEEILKWTEEKLPLWQRDAARRLFQQQSNLTVDDYNELYGLLKANHNLPNPLGLTPRPLEAAHLPKSPHAGETVILKALRDLKHVNRMAQGQELAFSPAGMTVIFGGNGSGKSGYVRVMKRACRARDQSEPVHTDATDLAADLMGTPEAIFEIQVNGTSATIQWTLSSKPPDELATFAVFDSHCARSYLTAEKEVAYLPYGLDVVENLADKVLPELNRRLNEELAAINVDRQPFQHLLGTTQVGQLVSNLSEKTDVAEVARLGTLTAQDTQHCEELDKALAEADPILKAKELRLSTERLKGLASNIESCFSWVDDAAIAQLSAADHAVRIANQAEAQAAALLQSGETLLPGTGEQAWKALFDAARKFSTGAAYPDKEFPHTHDGAVCLLCQQPLIEGAERLTRFEDYIQNDVAKTAAHSRQQLDELKRKLERADLDIGISQSLYGEIALLDDSILILTSSYQAALSARQKWMIAALDSHDWSPAPTLGENPRRRLRDLAARQLRSARTFVRAADEAKKKALTDEREELRARQNLALCKDALLALIERLKTKKAFEACEKDLKTKPISDKSKDLASGAVTSALTAALNDEFKQLGIGHIKTKLKERNEKGKIKHQLLLNLPTSKKLEQILSEGEQRAIALGSFLAELQLANHSGGIVLDDPVSSLDHKRRRYVAKRLSIESKQRQVLIFTHDVVFLHQLRDQCQRLKLTPLLCFLEPNGGYFGNVYPGLPWDHKSYGERIDLLEKEQRRFENLPWPADPPEQLANEIISQYNFLRATIERVTQDFVLNGTIQRFRDYIEVSRLKPVVGLEQSEVDELLRLNQRCHELVNAHDRASAKDEPPPTPDELKQDIADLRKVIQAIKDRRKIANL